MIKKMIASLLVISSPFITYAGASESGQYYEFKGIEDLETTSMNSKKHHHHHDNCDGRDGRDGRDGKDGCCHNGCCESNKCPDIAYFYLKPSNVIEENRVIQDRDPITWNPDIFTIKSDGINIDENDNTKIAFNHSGIYSITYTVFAKPFEESEVDWFTMELRLNNSPLAGSRFSQSSPLRYFNFSTSEDLIFFDIEPDATELVGQVITYIPANGKLQLFNVSGNNDDIDIRLDNEGGRGGIVASISIQKIADIVN